MLACSCSVCVVFFQELSYNEECHHGDGQEGFLNMLTLTTKSSAKAITENQTARSQVTLLPILPSVKHRKRSVSSDDSQASHSKKAKNINAATPETVTISKTKPSVKSTNVLKGKKTQGRKTTNEKSVTKGRANKDKSTKSVPSKSTAKKASGSKPAKIKVLGSKLDKKTGNSIVKPTVKNSKKSSVKTKHAGKIVSLEKHRGKSPAVEKKPGKSPAPAKENSKKSSVKIKHAGKIVSLEKHPGKSPAVEKQPGKSPAPAKGTAQRKLSVSGKGSATVKLVKIPCPAKSMGNSTSPYSVIYPGSSKSPASVKILEVKSPAQLKGYGPKKTKGKSQAKAAGVAKTSNGISASKSPAKLMSTRNKPVVVPKKTVSSAKSVVIGKLTSILNKPVVMPKKSSHQSPVVGKLMSTRNNPVFMHNRAIPSTKSPVVGRLMSTRKNPMVQSIKIIPSSKSPLVVKTISTRNSPAVPPAVQVTLKSQEPKGSVKKNKSTSKWKEVTNTPVALRHISTRHSPALQQSPVFVGSVSGQEQLTKGLRVKLVGMSPKVIKKGRLSLTNGDLSSLPGIVSGKKAGRARSLEPVVEPVDDPIRRSGRERKLTEKAAHMGILDKHLG